MKYLNQHLERIFIDIKILYKFDELILNKIFLELKTNIGSG